MSNLDQWTLERTYDEMDGLREFWHEHGAINEKGDFRQHLHVFIMARDSSHHHSHADNYVAGIPYVSNWRCYPWIPVWQKPDLAEISAYWQILKFNRFPAGWDTLWRHLYELRLYVRANGPNNGALGPYWMLRTHAAESLIASEMVTIKNKARNEMFKQVHRNLFSVSALATKVEEALRPYRVLTPQQEIEDEADRLSEIRSASVRIGDCDSPDRPPRCR